MKHPTLLRRVIFCTSILILVLAVPALANAQDSSPPHTVDSDCVTCHTNQSIMAGLGSSAPQQSPEEGIACWMRELPRQEAWQQIMVSDSEFVNSIHNMEGCISCHSGQSGALDRHIAHRGLIPDPSVDPTAACGECHSTEVELATTGLHQQLNGFKTVLEKRGADFGDPAMLEAFDQNCATCHATCGQCHISRPDVACGGLISGHKIQEFPSPDENCAACHGARVINELTGSNPEVQGSVHGLQENMTCYDCHNITEFHGSGTERSHRYDGEGTPSCLDCHPTADPGETEENLAHDVHWQQVACTVCHVSGPYENCYGCHIEMDENGNPSTVLDESKMQFKIGRNPDPDEVHPWDYVLVRHVPVEPDTFVEYGDRLLSDFANAPTWKLATPHNIQRVTLQNATCNNCHGHSELFLSYDDIRPARWETNSDVVVEQVPPRTELYRNEEETNAAQDEEEKEMQISDCLGDPNTASHVVPEVCEPDLCLQCHPGAHDRDWTLAYESMHTLYALVEPKGSVIVCQDCHSQEGDFDWSAEGYSEEQAAELIWDEFPEITTLEQKTSNPLWMLGLGLVIALAAGTPMMLRPKDEE